MKNKNFSATFKIIYILAFCLIISLPLIQMNLHLFTYIGLNEKRELKPRPNLNLNNIPIKNYPVVIDKYIQLYEDYFKDNIGFRDLFTQMANTIDVKVFNKSTNTQVYIGKNDYLYVNGDGKDELGEMNDYDRISKLSDKDIEKIAKNFKDYQDKLALKGIDFIFYIAPNKSTIYPEYVGREPLFKDKPSNYDRLLLALQREHVNTFDVKQLLLGYKDKYSLYYKRDTHWNNIAATLVANKLLQILGPKYGVDGSIDILKTHNTRYDGDLDGLLGIKSGVPEVTDDVRFNKSQTLFPKTIAYIDSFSYSVLPLMNDYFGERFAPHNLNQPVMATYSNLSPDVKIVYFEMVERYIPKLVNYDLGVLDDSNDVLKGLTQAVKLDLANDKSKANIQLNQTFCQKAQDGGYLYVSTGNDSNIIWDIPKTDINAVSIDFSRISDFGDPDPDKGDPNLQIFWAGEGQSFDEQRSVKVKVTPSKLHYVIDMKDKIKGAVKFRIDVGSKPYVEYDIKDVNLYK